MKNKCIDFVESIRTYIAITFPKTLIHYSLFTITLFLPLCVVGAVPDDEEDVYFILSGEADKAIAEGDYPTAIERIKEALATDPGNPSNVLLMSNLGLLYSAVGEDSLALDVLDHAHRMAPAMVQVLENRSKVLRRMHRDREAMVDLAAVIQLDSLNADARYYHGMMSMYAGDIDTARDDFAVLVSVAPDSYEANLAGAMMAGAEGDYAKALPYYRRLVEMDACPEFYCGLAQCYLVTGELSEAAALLGEALKAYPDDANLYYYRAWLNRDSFLLRDARRDADTAIALGADRRVVEALFK